MFPLFTFALVNCLNHISYVFWIRAVLSGQVRFDETLFPEALLSCAKIIFQREMMDFIPSSK